jgi:tetratricopeptide (TPR) repeat protein
MRVTLGLVLVVGLVPTSRETVASFFAATKSLDGVAQSARWDDSNPEIPGRYARELANQGRDADALQNSRAFENATRLGPYRAENWAGLGEALELTGDSSGAARAYRRALELFPRSPDINWEYANSLLRSGDTKGAMGPLRAAIEGDPSLRIGAFDLAWRAGIPRDQILAALPAQEEIFSAHLDYLNATGRLDETGDAWKRLLTFPEAIDFDAACRYLDTLLHSHRVDELAPVWATFASHAPDRIRWQPDAANRITHGRFEEPMVDGGFRWRIAPIEGADASLDTETVHNGSRSLLVHFDGKHNLQFGNVAQYVAAEPDTRYRFIAYTRSEGITTGSGLWRLPIQAIAAIAPSHASAEIIPMRENENTIATRSTEATGSTRKHFTISGWPINSTKERHVRRRERCLALRQR